MASGQKRQWESGARQFWAMGALQLGDTPGATDAHVSLAVSSAGGRATQPYDGLANSLRTPAAREQLFKDVESWKPRSLTGRQECPNWFWSWSEDNVQEDVRFFSGIHSTPRCRCPLVTSRRDSIWSTKLWMAGQQTPLKRRLDFGGRRR